MTTFRPPRGALGSLVEAAVADCARRRRLGPPATTPHPARTPGRFVAALSRRGPSDFPLICEVKRASPSAGVLQERADAAAVATRYVDAGARCVSVLTESSRFHGSLDDLREVRTATPAPLLRKDFIVDPFMVEEAAAAGADAVLLIAAAIEPSRLLELADAARARGLDVLLELIYERDLDVLGLRQWPLVGVNARDLETLEMDAGRFARFAPRISAPGRILVAESGVRTAEDIARYAREGAGAALVGESLMRAADPASAIRALMGAA